MRRPTSEPVDEHVKIKKTLRVVLVFSLLIAGIIGVGLSRRDRRADTAGLASLEQGVPAPSPMLNVAMVQVAGPILPNAQMPHPWRGPCQNCHQILRVAQNNMMPIAASNLLGAATMPAPMVFQAAAQPSTPIVPSVSPRKRPFHEGHWQGIEVVALTAPLALDLGLAPQDRGVVIDQVSFPADGQGFAAGDLIVSLGGVPTPHLADFVTATQRVRDLNRTDILAIRNGQPVDLVLVAERLGAANGETPPIIPPDAVPPRGCAQAHAALMHLDTLGPCTDCHIVKARGPLPLDLADVLPKPAFTPAALDPLCLPPPAF